MDLEHSFIIPVPPEQAWQALLDVEQVAPCMPGATVNGFDGEVISGKIKIKVGPVQMTYAGKARFTEKDEATKTVVLEASGKETRGSGTASATIRSSLQDENGQTRVLVRTTMTVTGRPAQFGRGVMAEVGGRIIGKFATNLAAELSGEGAAAPAAASAGEAPDTPAASTPVEGTGAAAASAGDGGNGLSGDAAQLPIEELNLPVRSFNSLRREGVHTVGGLAARTEKELLAIDGLGPQSIKEIKSRLADHGLALTTPGLTADESAAGSVAAGTAAPGAAASGAGGAAPAGTAAAGTATGSTATGTGGPRPAAVSPDAQTGTWDAGAAAGPLGRERPAAAAQRPAAGRGRPRPAQRGRPAAAQAGRAGRGRAARRRGAAAYRAPPPPRVPRLTRGARCRSRRSQPSRVPDQPAPDRPAPGQPAPRQPVPARPVPASGMPRSRAADLDAADPLAGFRDRFAPLDPGLIYLDGNSLGMLPAATARRLAEVIREDWGTGLIRSWGHWMDLPGQVGDLLGEHLLGAGPGQVTVCDSTTVNLYKLAWAAVDARPGRPVLVTDDDNFPTDRYVLAGIAARSGGQLRMIRTDPDEGIRASDVRAAIGPDTALVCLSHVAYRSGALADMAAITRLAHEAGALVLWDLCHSAGSVPVDLDGCAADLAVGCTYKYLNAGPGAPAFLYVRRGIQDQLTQPIQGWFGQQDQFMMGPRYEPAPGMARFSTGTPNIPGTVAVQEGTRLLAEAGIAALRDKGIRLTSYLIELADAWLTPLGCELASPRDPARRGSHVTLRHPEAGRISQALIHAGVIGDFRTPDRLRLGPAPITTRFADVWDAMDTLRQILETGAWAGLPPAPEPPAQGG